MIILRKTFTKIKLECPITKEEQERLDAAKEAYYKKYPIVFDGPMKGKDSKEYKDLLGIRRDLQKKYPEYYGTKEFSEREPVSKADMKKAEESGVVQKRPDGKWGIIAKRKREWWSAEYDTREDASAALRAYQASKRG